MKAKVVAQMVVCGLIIGAVGCEWEASSDEDSWSDRYSWVNFSGMYRGQNAAVVAGFSLTTSTDSGGDSGTDQQIIVNDEPGGTAPLFQTELAGMLAKRPGIVPGSVTMLLQQSVESGSSGSATDDGNGVLNGTVNLVGLDPSTARPLTGTINYDTGAWTLQLISPGLLTDAYILTSYAYVPGSGGVVEDPEEGEDKPWSGIYVLRIEQTGQHLVFTDGTGGSYSGVITKLTTPGGDQNGLTSGQVEAIYEVTGNAAGGRPIRISGSLSAAYTGPDAESGGGSGTLASRMIQGIWFELSGAQQTADVRGYAESLTTTVPDVDTTTTDIQ